MRADDAGMDWMWTRGCEVLRLPARPSCMTETKDRAVYSEASDAELMAWSAEGDRRAFDQIVTRHGRLALRIARRLVPDAAQAEDLAQEAMMRAWTHADRFDGGRAGFSTWLYRIVTNLCIDHSRQRRAGPLPDDFEAPDPSPRADEALDVAQRHDALVGALRALPPRHLAAMTLVYDEGLSGVETARVMGVSAKAVERLLARARTMVRARLLPNSEL